MSQKNVKIQKKRLTSNRVSTLMLFLSGIGITPWRNEVIACGRGLESRANRRSTRVPLEEWRKQALSGQPLCRSSTGAACRGAVFYRGGAGGQMKHRPSAPLVSNCRTTSRPAAPAEGRSAKASARSPALVLFPRCPPNLAAPSPPGAGRFPAPARSAANFQPPASRRHL